MREHSFETPWTRGAIRCAPMESSELLRQCEECSIRLGEPGIVATSSGPRVVRAILPTEPFWRNWERYFWTVKKVGIIVSKHNENCTARLWTRLPEPGATGYGNALEQQHKEQGRNRSIRGEYYKTVEMHAREHYTLSVSVLLG